MMKNRNALLLAAIAIAGFSGAQAVPFVIVSAVAQTAAATVVVSDLAKSFDPAANLDLSGKVLGYKLPVGVTAKIIGTTYEQLVDFNGNIRRPISPKTTKLTFELSDASGAKAVTPTFEVSVPVDPYSAKKAQATDLNVKPAVVPALQEWVGGQGSFVPAKDFSVVILEKQAALGDPTLKERAELFAKELSDVFGRKIDVKVVASDAEIKKGNIVLDADTKAVANLGKEGYVLYSMTDGLWIKSADPQGAFWGTRSILQVFKQNNNTFPCGVAVDYPQYPVRGFMYDVGRKPATLKAMTDVLKTMSYYKMNDYHIHLNDNFIWMYDYTKIPNGKNASEADKKAAIAEVLKAAPTAFRLESDVVGKDGTPLTATDHYYTKREFAEFIDLAKLYGVMIVPEFDAPGHAMSFVRVRPDLMYRGKVSKAHDVERTAMLDASTDIYDEATGKTYREETLEFVQSVFDEYLVGKNGEEPVFRTPVIHIGTDEYYGDPEDYRAFADEMLKYIKSRGYTPRLWGSLSVKRGNTPVDGTGSQINIWNHGWQNPLLALEHNFDLVNIIDVWTYVVPSGSGSTGGYGDQLNLPFLYSQNWHPHKMSHKDEVYPGHPKMLGAQWAVWNDNSFCRDTGLTDYDLFDRIHKSCAVLAEKTWNTGEDTDYKGFMKVVKAVDFAPLSNPTYRIEGKDAEDWLFELKGPLTLSKKAHRSTGLDGIAPNYIAEFRVCRTGDDAEQILFSGPTGKFLAVQKDTGKVGITSDTWDYSFDYTLPKDKWVTLKLVAKGRTLTLFADGKEIGAPVRHLFPKAHKFSTFVFPLEMIGDLNSGFIGELADLTIAPLVEPGTENAIKPDDIDSIKASSAHGQGADGDASAMIDGDPDTYWHTRYAPVKDNPPFEVEVALKKPMTLAGFAYLPRQNGDNGNIKKAELFGKTADGAWVKLGVFENAGSRDLQTLTFPEQSLQGLKLVILEGFGGFGTIAEIYPLKPIAKKKK